MLSKQMKTQMMTLLEMGFTDYKKNEQVLQKHKQQLEAAIEELYSA